MQASILTPGNPHRHKRKPPYLQYFSILRSHTLYCKSPTTPPPGHESPIYRRLPVPPYPIQQRTLTQRLHDRNDARAFRLTRPRSKLCARLPKPREVGLLAGNQQRVGAHCHHRFQAHLVPGLHPEPRVWVRRSKGLPGFLCQVV